MYCSDGCAVKSFRDIHLIIVPNVGNGLNVQAEKHIFNIFTARRYASAVLAVVVCPCVCVSVCVSVCHKPVLYQNGYRYDHANNATR